jgi:hypothetical protein
MYKDADLKIFFDNALKHSFSSYSAWLPQSSFGMRIVPDNQKPGYGWVGKRKNTAFGSGPW